GKNETAVNLRHLPYLKMTITDSGHGMEPKIIDRIFDPYFSTRGGKRGMGLTIAYSVIKKHDGLVTVLSAPGNGTSFKVYLPASVDSRG
ncbi:MAG TPA: ATP-binding protein, partial [Nitrospiria bacterium]|nr:ATP-binding protein [Nitrospiria bacterium]